MPYNPLCCLLTSESFGCHDIARHRWGGPAGWESCCFSLSEGLPRSLWWLPASSGCTARGWGATGGGSGALWVGGAFVQYVQPLVSGSRPSWSRPTRTDSRRSRRPTMTTGTQRRRRAGNGGGRPVTETPAHAARTPGSLLRGPVSTALTSTSPAPVRPAGIVGILRFFFGVRRRCVCDVSTMDTDDLPGPARPLPFDLTLASWTTSLPRVPARASVSEVRRQHSDEAPRGRRVGRAFVPYTPRPRGIRHDRDGGLRGLRGLRG